MREEIYRELKQKHHNFDAKYTQVVSMGKIKYDKQNSQIRGKGHVLSKVPGYTVTMRTHGPKEFPPVTVKRLPNGDFELKDGNTRALAAEQAGTDLFISTWHDDTLSPTNDQWEDVQMKLNDHRKASPSSAEDIKDYLCRRQTTGSMTLKVGFPYVGNEQRYVDTAVDLYRKMLPHAGKDKAWWQRAIENTLKGYVGTRYESYTKKLLFDMYRTLYNFTGSKVGDISGNEVVFPFMSLSHLNPNVIGSIAAKQMDNPGVKYILLYSVGSLMGKNDDKLKAERRKVTDWVAKVSKHYGWSIVVYFAPQIKTGPNKENLYQFRIKP